MFTLLSVEASRSDPADKRDEWTGEQKENNNSENVIVLSIMTTTLRGEYWHEVLSRMVLFCGRINEEFATNAKRGLRAKQISRISGGKRWSHQNRGATFCLRQL